jgi:hypothetical protein
MNPTLRPMRPSEILDRGIPAATLLYYDQRIRKEGFDVEWMMQSAGMTEEAGAAAGVESAAPEAASVPVEDAGA